MNNGQPKALYYGHLSGMRSLFALFLSIISTQVMATHIIGGNMYYDHLGGNQYRVTLVLYRDCGPDNANNTGFDAAAQLAVYKCCRSAGDVDRCSVFGRGPGPGGTQRPVFDRTTHGVCEDRGLRTCVHPTSNCWWVYDQLSTVLPHACHGELERTARSDLYSQYPWTTPFHQQLSALR
jgi:hypothetical protein